MGAKLPGRPKTRRPTCKCDLCGSTFLNIQALRTHQACLHPKTKRVAYKPKIEVIAKRKVVPLKKLNVLKPGRPTKRNKEIAAKVSKTKIENKVVSSNRSAFECPLCSKLFTVYFSAYRHIQNNHCVNDKGETVSPNSSNLIKPLLIEQCVSCNAKVESEIHKCKEIVTNNDENTEFNQTCLGCNQEFKSVQTYDTHIKKEHSDDADYFFFPDVNKFMVWKKNMETQMEANYLVMKDKENCKVFHCNHFASSKTTSKSCPSSINTRVFNKGMQVAFYKRHYGHTVKEYTIPETFKNFHITSLMQVPESSNNTVINGNEVYLEFKTLMENVVLEAAKLNLSNLRLLLGKAYEMTLVLNSNKNDKEKQNLQTSKRLTDDEISKFLDEPQQNKRTLDQSGHNAKKIKLETVAKIEPRVVPKADTQSPLVLSEQDNDTNIIIKDVKSLASPTRLNSFKAEENAKNSSKSMIQSPTSFCESYKNFVDANFGTPVEKPKTRRKEVMKTKMGQFKPNIVSTPKRKDDLKVEKSPRIYSYHQPKADIQYEVLERENDCNILIIKI